MSAETYLLIGVFFLFLAQFAMIWWDHSQLPALALVSSAAALILYGFYLL